MDTELEDAADRLGNVSISEQSQPLKEIQLNQLDQNDLYHKTPQKPLDRPSESSDTPSHPGKRTASGSEVSEEDQKKFNKLIMKSKQLAGEGDVSRALELNKRALRIYYSEKLVKRIEKMEAYLKECEEKSSEDEDDGMVHLGNGYYLYKDLAEKLFSHQKEGVLWFWSLFKKKKGGILGDDMGLGKTIQVITFLSGMFDCDKVNVVLIVMPVSIMPNWEKEFTKWPVPLYPGPDAIPLHLDILKDHSKPTQARAPGIRVTTFHGNSKKERERCLLKVQKRGGVCLTTYGLVVTSWEQLGQQNGREFVWDYLILDEGHKIKNPTKTTKGVHAIPAKNRIILTGTPIQNNLRELWSLFDFVHDGALLGTSRTFKMEYENPITRARERDATAGEKRLGSEMAESLKRIIAPYFLRRTKAEVTEKNKDDKKSVEEKSDTKQMPSFTRKNDLIVWVFLSEKQQSIYQDFLELESVKELLMTKKSPLVALTVLKKICDHPRLLSQRACAQLGLDGQDRIDDSMLETAAGDESAATKVEDIPDELLMSESGKVSVLVELLHNLKLEGHRTLIFSQSRKLLDILQKVLRNRGHKIMRMDGTVRELCERDKRIKKFQTDPTYTIFLLTTQVGGVGLTLTAADRVIIYDPSWNPATDAQAVDRVFRIGQDKNVVIYRLITCASVEEKIYRRQIFKDSITKQTTGQSKNPYRYFSKQELRELFTLNNPRVSTTQQQLEELHSNHRKSDTKLDSHIAFLHSLEIFGLSDHDLMFSKDSAHQELEEHEEEFGNDYIQSRVKKAQDLISLESNLPSQMRDMEIKSRSSDPTRRPTGNTPTFQGMEYSPPNKFSSADQEENREPLALHNGIKSETDDENIKKPRKTSEEVIDLSREVFDDSNVIDINSSSDESEEKLQPVIKVESSPLKVKLEPVDSFVSRPVVKQEPCDINSKVTIKKELIEQAMENSVGLNLEKVGMNHVPNIASIQSPASAVPSSPIVTNFSPKKTPVSLKRKKIVQEEILISPDAGSPVVMMRRKSTGHQYKNRNRIMSDQSGSPSTPVRQLNENQINSTLFKSDTTPKIKQECPEVTMIQDSPSPSAFRNLKKKDNLYTTIIEDSPQSSFRTSISYNKSGMCVADSTQNTPVVTDDKFSSIDDSVIEDSVCEESLLDNDKSLGSASRLEKQDSHMCEADVSNHVANVNDADISKTDSANSMAIEDSICSEEKSENVEEIDDSMNESLDNDKSLGSASRSETPGSHMCEPCVSTPKAKVSEDDISKTDSANRMATDDSICSESKSENAEESDDSMNKSSHSNVSSENSDIGGEVIQRNDTLSELENDSPVVKCTRRRSTYKKMCTLQSSSDEDEVGSNHDDSCDKENLTADNQADHNKSYNSDRNEDIEDSVHCDETNEDIEDSVHCDETSDVEDSGEDTDLSGFIASNSEEEEYESSYEDEDEHSEEESDENSEDDEDGPPEHLKEEYFDHIDNAKKMYKAAQYQEALAPVLKALDIYPAEELQAFALKIHQKMKS